MLDLTEAESSVLQALTVSRVTASVVTLAATMWVEGEDTLGADPVGYVAWVIESLTERGLVTYRMTRTDSHAGPRAADGHAHVEHNWFTGLPHSIRLTRDGWAAAGYPLVVPEVGRSGHMVPARPGDLTNYRNHQVVAHGDAIECLPLPLHRAKYPTHIHPYINDEEDPTMSDKYQPTTNEERTMAVDLFRTHGSYVKVSQETGLSTNRVRHLIGLARQKGEVGPPLRKRSPAKESISAKRRVLAIISDAYMPMTTDQVASRLGFDGGAYVSRHDLVHLLHSLRRQQMIEFVEDKATGNGADPIRIVAAGRRTDRDHADVTVEPMTDPEGTPDVEKVVPAEWAPSAYPLLDALLARKDAIEEAHRRAKRYMEAANLLSDDDEDTALLLMEKSGELFDSVALTDIEDEYLRYAAVHA